MTDRRSFPRALALVLGAFLALAGVLTLVSVAGAHGNHEDNVKVWVCKYVGQPGDFETLKPGKQPITVSVNAADAYIGADFADGQTHSYVIDFQTDENTSEHGNSYTGEAQCPTTPSETATPSESEQPSETPAPTETPVQTAEPSETPAATPTPEQSIGEPSVSETPSASEPASSQPEASQPDVPNTAMADHGGITDDGWLLIYGTLMVIILGSAFVSAARSR